MSFKLVKKICKLNIQNKKLTSSEKLILILLADYVGAKDESKEPSVWPSLNTLVGLSGMTKKWILKILKSLEQKEFITIEQKKIKNRKHNYYIIAVEAVNKLCENEPKLSTIGILTTPVSTRIGVLNIHVTPRIGVLSTPEYNNNKNKIYQNNNQANVNNFFNESKVLGMQTTFEMLTSKAMRLGIKNEKTLTTVVFKYGLDYVKQKIELLELSLQKNNILNPEGWFLKAVEQNYCLRSYG